MHVRVVKIMKINLGNIWLLDFKSPGLRDQNKLSSFMDGNCNLPDGFIQSDLQCIQVIHLYCQYVFPGNQTHNLCTANAML